METDIYKTTTTTGGSTNKSEEMYNEAREKMSHAYDKTAEALSGTYDQAITYARENPGRSVLIALGIGVGLGMLLASGRRSRVRRYGEPIINAVSDIAMEIIRGF